MQYVYTVTVKSKLENDKTSDSKLSQECYTTLGGAQKFIMSRNDCPQKISDFLYSTTTRTYLIHELTVKE